MTPTSLVLTAGSGTSTDFGATINSGSPGVGGSYVVRACCPIDSTKGIPELYVDGQLAQVELVARAPDGEYDVIEVIGEVAAGKETGIVVNETVVSNPQRTPNLTDLTAVTYKLEHSGGQVMTCKPFDPAHGDTIEVKVHRDGQYLKTVEYHSRFSGGGDTILGLFSWVTWRSDTEIVEVDHVLHNGIIDPAGNGTSGGSPPDQYANENPSIDGEVFFKYLQVDNTTMPTNWAIVSQVERHSMDLPSGYLINDLGLDGSSNQQWQYLAPRGIWARRFAFHPTGEGPAATSIVTGGSKGYSAPNGANSYFQMGHFGPSKVKMPKVSADFTWPSGGTVGGDDTSGSTAMHNKWENAYNRLTACYVNNTSDSGVFQSESAALEGCWAQPCYIRSGSAAGGTLVGGDIGMSWWLESPEQEQVADLLMQGTMDRSPVAQVHPDTGALLSAESFADANIDNPDKYPWQLSLTGDRQDFDIDWWMHPNTSSPQWATSLLLPTGNAWSSLPGSDTAPQAADFQWYDSGAWHLHNKAHTSRAMHFLVPNVWRRNDPLTKKCFTMYAELFQQNWHEYDVAGGINEMKSWGPTRSVKWHIDHFYTGTNPGAPGNEQHWVEENGAGPLDREDTWQVYKMIACYPFQDDTWRTRCKAWVDMCLEAWYRTAAIGSRIAYRSSHPTGSCPDPYLETAQTSCNAPGVSFGPPNLTLNYGAIPETYDHAQMYMLCFQMWMWYAAVVSVYEGVDVPNTDDAEDFCVTLPNGCQKAYVYDPNDERGYQVHAVVGETGELPFTEFTPWNFASNDNDSNGWSVFEGYATLSLYGHEKRVGSSVLRDKIRQSVGQGGGTKASTITEMLNRASQHPISETTRMEHWAPVIGEWQV